MPHVGRGMHVRECHLVMPAYSNGQAIIFCPGGFYLLLSCFLSSFFPHLISAVGDWMSTILPHMMWPLCEFRMQILNVLHAAHWKYRTQKSPSGHHRTTLSGHIFSTIAYIDNRKKRLVKQQYLHMSPQYGELRPTSRWNLLASLGQPS